MDREYLEDYEQKEKAEYARFKKGIQEGKLSFEKDRYPPDNRFIKIQKPVASTSPGSSKASSLWAQIPFCGSLIMPLAPISKSKFEQLFFKVSEIPKIIDFIRETGKLKA